MELSKVDDLRFIDLSFHLKIFENNFPSFSFKIEKPFQHSIFNNLFFSFLSGDDEISEIICEFVFLMRDYFTVDGFSKALRKYPFYFETVCDDSSLFKVDESLK
jgi:hypothetical protein